MKILILTLTLFLSTPFFISAQENIENKEQAMVIKKEAKQDRNQLKSQVKRARVERKVTAKMKKKKIVQQAKKRKKLAKRKALSAMR